ncbi:MAG: hypothetical protein GX181_00950 [Synergistaceae bacterium]|nr:hypothetical protein [Synergistaceae bacterium]
MSAFILFQFRRDDDNASAVGISAVWRRKDRDPSPPLVATLLGIAND